jgi:hypothetical protein
MRFSPLKPWRTLRTGARIGLERLASRIPEAIWLRLLKLRWQGLSAHGASAALRALLTEEKALAGCIDQEAIRYEHGIHVKHRLTRYHDFFVQRIYPDERVLDVGCGNGAVAYDVADRAKARVVGIDLTIISPVPMGFLSLRSSPRRCMVSLLPKALTVIFQRPGTLLERPSS